MPIINVGISYQHAPIEIRENVTFSNEAAAIAMSTLNAWEGISENVILSTCNRTEIYAAVEDAQEGIRAIGLFLAEWFHRPTSDESLSYFTRLYDEEAVEHLFKLASGLESMVIGETQILGQVKDAFQQALDTNSTGKTLNALFRRVITFAKHVHKDTSIGRQAVSVSYVAVELAKKIFQKLEEQHVLIIGAGEMSELSLKNLQGAGVSNITIMNRTFQKANSLAERFGAQPASYAQFTEKVCEADIVITSTASRGVVLTKERVAEVMASRIHRPLVLLDIAVPRDVATEARELENVFVYDMDDLSNVARDNLASRKKVAQELEGQVTAELRSFQNWLAMQDAIPVIKALQEKSSAIQEKTMASMKRKIPDLTEREVKVLQKHTKSIIHQLLEEPLKKAKEMGDSQEELERFRDIFGLEVDGGKELSVSGEERDYMLPRK